MDEASKKSERSARSEVSGSLVALRQMPPSPEDVLWRVWSYGEQEVAAGRRYRHENWRRKALNTVVIQQTIRGEIGVTDGGMVDGAVMHAAPKDHLCVFVYGQASWYGSREPMRSAYACRWVNVTGAGLVEHASAFIARFGPVLDCRSAPGLILGLRELINKQGGEGDRGGKDPTQEAAGIHALLTGMFDHADRRFAREQSPVDRAVDRILREPRRAWSLKQIAGESGVSREHLSRVFAERMGGQTPAAYIGRARLDHAVTLLSQTSLPLEEVARQAGYGSAHTLARRVRGATGRPPGAFRREGVAG